MWGGGGGDRGGGGGGGVFFFKQKTAYEIYQCDWSSDVCSSDLSDWKVLKGEKELEEDRNPYTLFNSRIPAVSRRAGERVEYFRPRIDKAVEEYIVRAEEKSRRSKYSI